MNLKHLLAAATLALGLSGISQAALLDGQTVNYQYYYPGLGNPYGNSSNGDYVVGAGVEVANIADGMGTLDLSDSNIYVDYTNSSGWNPAAFNGFIITDIFNSIADFTGVTINAATNLVGFDLSRITFDGNHIWVNWQGLSFDANTVVSLDINGGEVPEPESLALLGLGVLIMVGSLKKRKTA